MLELLTPDNFYEKFIQSKLPNFKEFTYKIICKELLEQQNRENLLPYQYGIFSEWIGKFGNIDIITDDLVGHILIGSCSYNTIYLYEDYEWLLFCAKKAKIEPHQIYLFSEKGFQEALIKEAQKDMRMNLITLEKRK